MAEAPAQPKTLRIADLFDRDLTDDEIAQIRQKIDTLARVAKPTEAAHHHDVTPLV
jgi:hypothetical protein